MLEKIAALLEKVGQICRTVAENLAKLQMELKRAKGLKNLITKAKMERSAINVAVRSTVGYGIDGGTHPWAGWWRYHAGTSGHQGWQDTQGAAQ